MTGVEMISAERERQVAVEGWSAEHDAEHAHEELVGAAICYATNKGQIHVRIRWHEDSSREV